MEFLLKYFAFRCSLLELLILSSLPNKTVFEKCVTYVHRLKYLML